jgi:hypothetical protein
VLIGREKVVTLLNHKLRRGPEIPPAVRASDRRLLLLLQLLSRNLLSAPGVTSCGANRALLFSIADRTSTAARGKLQSYADHTLMAVALWDAEPSRGGRTSRSR